MGSLTESKGARASSSALDYGNRMRERRRWTLGRARQRSGRARCRRRRRRGQDSGRRCLHGHQTQCGKQDLLSGGRRMAGGLGARDRLWDSGVGDGRGGLCLYERHGSGKRVCGNGQIQKRRGLLYLHVAHVRSMSGRSNLWCPGTSALWAFFRVAESHMYTFPVVAITLAAAISVFTAPPVDWFGRVRDGEWRFRPTCHTLCGYLP